MPTVRLQERLREHKDQVTELRAELGDPAQALSKFMRDRFEWQAIAPTDGPDINGVLEVPDDDDPDAW